MAALIPPSEETERFDFNFEELDDSEYSLPQIDTPPSLESILNEPDDDANVLDEGDVGPIQYQGDVDVAETSSLSSQDSLLDTFGKTRGKKRPIHVRSSQHGSILKRMALKNIAAQLMSAAERVDAGMPTALAVSSYIAIGTSHGLVLVFDPNQVLKWCLGSRAVGAQYGSASSISFNHDCTRLLAGFAKGQMTMWDITSGKLIRTIMEAHPPGTAVLHIKFTDDPTVAICNDSGGSVFELEMKRLIGVRTCESRCLFSGSRGEVCAIEPLHMNLTIKDHPMKDVLVLAMGTLSKVLVVTVRPKLKVLFTHPLKGDARTLPLLSWQFVIIQITDHERVIDPVLAFARDNVIHFYQAICNHADDIRFTFLQKMEMDYKLLSIMWLSPKTMVAIDTSERLHVIDVRSEEELEVLDISDVQLCYASSHFKSLATGGNVSKALAWAGERACYSSIVVYAGQLLILGTKAVHVLSIRTWIERLDLLVKLGKHQAALKLAQTFYENKAKAVLGLMGGHHRRKKIVADKMLDLLYELVDVSMTRNLPERGNLHQLMDYYESVVPVCVDYCLTLNRADVLFGKLFEQFSKDEIAKGTFLECLEPYILQDQLTFVTPSIMKDFLEHFERNGMIQKVEQCLVHLDITSLDIHQVVGLCWSHGLYDAVIYVYNRGMHDYVTPLQELLSLLGAAVQCPGPLTDDRIRLGNKLLVYISCCLAGRAYPLGDIPASRVDTVKEQVFHCVTSLHTTSPNDDEPTYPALRTLLKFDTREFLNVLALAFEEPEFNSDEGVRKRQRVVDILLQIMVEGVGFTPAQVGTLFTFLARQMARHENTILVNRLLFEQVLEFLSTPAVDCRHEERQQAMMELLNAGGLHQINLDRLLALAENAKFYRVSELLYSRQRQFDRILMCYLRDPARKVQSFSFIESILQSDGYSNNERNSVKAEANSRIGELMAIDCKKTAELVMTYFSHELSDVVSRLRHNDQEAYRFLRDVIELRITAVSAVYQVKQTPLDPALEEYYIELMCRYEPDQVVNHIRTNDGYRVEPTLEICRKHGLREASAYLLEQRGDVSAAQALLIDNLQSKLDYIYANLNTDNNGGVSSSGNNGGVSSSGNNGGVSSAGNNGGMSSAGNNGGVSSAGNNGGVSSAGNNGGVSSAGNNGGVSSAGNNGGVSSAGNNGGVSSARHALDALIQLCQRNCARLDEEKRQDLWFPVLEVMMTSQRNIKEKADKQLWEEYKDLTRHVLNSMMGQIALPAILHKTMQDPSCNSGKFGEFRELILGLLDTYNYEKTLLNTCNSLLNQDLHAQFAGLHRAANRGLVSRSNVCPVCDQAFQRVADTITVFGCGHVYHVTCISHTEAVSVMDGHEHWACLLCTNARRGRSTSFLNRLPVNPDTRPLSATELANREPVMSEQQMLAYETLRRNQKTPSRMAILGELSKPRDSSSSRRRQSYQTYQTHSSNSPTSLLSTQQLQLNLMPPPIDT